jgi:hypothetical protein
MDDFHSHAILKITEYAIGKFHDLGLIIVPIIAPESPNRRFRRSGGNAFNQINRVKGHHEFNTVASGSILTNYFNF